MDFDSDFLLGALTTLGALATALFTGIPLARGSLAFTACAFPASTEPACPRELQQNPRIFLLHITFSYVPYPVQLHSIKVVGARIPHDLCDEAGCFTGVSLLNPKFRFGAAPLPIPLSPNEKDLEIWLPIELLNPDSPLVDVVVRYSWIRRTSRRVLCKHR